MSESRYETEAMKMAESLLAVSKELKKLTKCGSMMMSLPEPVTPKEKAIRDVFFNTYEPILKAGELLAMSGGLYYGALSVTGFKK